MPADKGSIIIKKVKKGGHGGGHGGAWKIAYADFVTAMMAFFLLLWLLNSVTQEQLEGIADYFAPTVASVSQSGSGEILGGTTVSQEGTQSDTLGRPTVTLDLPPPSAGAGGQALEKAPSDAQDQPEEAALVPPVETDLAAEAEAARKAAEDKQFKDAAAELKDAMETLPEFQQLAKSLIIDNTPEGLRIQIADQDGLAMFASGSATLYEHTERVLGLVAQVIQKMPQRISISGHTDSVPFTTRGEAYTNWELSADRANSARRYLVEQGIAGDRLSHIVGKAETEPLMPEDPSNARNRRLSIILLRGTGEMAPADAATPGGEASPTGETGNKPAADAAPVEVDVTAPERLAPVEIDVTVPQSPAPAASAPTENDPTVPSPATPAE